VIFRVLSAAPAALAGIETPIARLAAATNATPATTLRIEALLIYNSLFCLTAPMRPRTFQVYWFGYLATGEEYTECNKGLTLGTL
jgi:hypothetical protein